jgi:hypothetical protein
MCAIPFRGNLNYTVKTKIGQAEKTIFLAVFDTDAEGDQDRRKVASVYERKIHVRRGFPGILQYSMTRR